mmetsp:Transcript_36307/g.114593  ORF Transcript_36307/g.114593 Transcript_36307/m.114593 type:complete len:319 (-) Transcript_36307:743-1699(-)
MGKVQVLQRAVPPRLLQALRDSAAPDVPDVVPAQIQRPQELVVYQCIGQSDRALVAGVAEVQAEGGERAVVVKGPRERTRAPCANGVAAEVDSLELGGGGDGRGEDAAAPLPHEVAAKVEGLQPRVDPHHLGHVIHVHVLDERAAGLLPQLHKPVDGRHQLVTLGAPEMGVDEPHDDPEALAQHARRGVVREVQGFRHLLPHCNVVVGDERDALLHLLCHDRAPPDVLGVGQTHVCGGVLLHDHAPRVQRVRHLLRGRPGGRQVAGQAPGRGARLPMLRAHGLRPRVGQARQRRPPQPGTSLVALKHGPDLLLHRDLL